MNGHPLVDAPMPGTPEWLRLMSASKIAAVVGLSPYESRFSLWFRMSGLLDPEPDNDTFRRGHYLEPAIAEWFADKHPELTVEPGQTWALDADDRITATPDRLLFDISDVPCAVLECKSASDMDGWGPAGSDEIPVGYRAQVQYQMHVVGVKVAYVAVLLPFLSFREYRIDYNEAEAAQLIKAGQEFMDSLAGQPAEQRPDLDAHTATYETLRELHPDIDPDDVELPETVARDFCDSRYALDAAQAAERLARAKVLDALGNAKRAMYLGSTIATRQPNGDRAPKLVAGRNLPTFNANRSAA